MKNVFKTLLLVGSLATFMFGCTGDDGALGPAGANGTNGTNGTNGKDGNANVVYTDWKTIDWTGGFFQPSNKLSATLIVKGTDEPLFTRDAMDKAVIYSYFKINELAYDNANAEYKLVERIVPSGNGGYAYFKRPGSTKNQGDDFSILTVNTGNPGVNYFRPYINFQTSIYDANGNQVTDSRFAGKLAEDYREYAKAVTYRHVIIYGGTKAARVNNPVDMSDYNAVKAFYKLPN